MKIMSDVRFIGIDLAGRSDRNPSGAADELLQKDLRLLRGKDLKDYEDMLDAFFCAYLGFYFWCWGWERNELFGDTESGYILNPHRQEKGREPMPLPCRP